MTGRGRLRFLSAITALHRDLRILYVSLLVWTFGLGLYSYVWSIYLRTLGATPGEVGLAFAIGYVAFAASMIPGGILSNRYDLRKVIIWSWALSIPVPLILILARTWQVATVGLVLLQGTSFGLPAYNAFIVANTESHKISSAFGSSYSAGTLGYIFSPVVGSVLLTLTGFQTVFMISFILFSVSTIILLPIGTHPPKLEDHRIRLERPRTRWEVVLLIFLVISATAFSLVFPFLPIYYQDRFLLNLSTIQLMGAAYYAGATVFANVIGSRAEKKGGGSAMATAVLLAAFGLFGLILIPSAIFIVLFAFLFGAARTPSYIAYSLLSKNRREGATRAGTYGFYLTIESIGLVVGSYFGGYAYGISPFLLLGTSAVLFLGLAFLAFGRIGSHAIQPAMPG